MAGHLSVWQNGVRGATRKSEVGDLVGALRERCPWPVARRYLADAGIDAGTGWTSAVEEVTFLDDLSHVDVDTLYRSFLEHVCCGEKSVRYYELPGATLDTLKGYLSSKVIQLSRLPRPGQRPHLQHTNTSAPTLVCVQETPKGSVAIFSTIRTFDERKELDGSALPDAVREALPAFDEFIAVRRVKYQAYGTIWVPKRGKTVEVTVDAHVDQTVHGVDEFHQFMYSQLHQLSGSAAVISPMNLFGAIKGIYSNAEEGILSDLSFVTTTGSVKHERMRSHESLRQETYHVGGLEALATEIEPFRLGVFWRRASVGTKEVSLPQLSLSGSLGMVGVTTPQLFSAEIRRATGFDDFEFVRGKLNQYA